VQLQFASVQDTVLTKVLKSILEVEKVPYEDSAIAAIVENAHGSIRDAQSILEGFIRSGNVTAQNVNAVYQAIDRHSILSFFGAVLNKKIRDASTIASNWVKLGCAPDLIVHQLIEYLSSMIMDWTITDATLKKIVQHQRDVIGEYRISLWIEALTQHLAFIRNFPMAYSLSTNIMIIKLVSHIFSESEVRKEKSEKQKESKEVKAQASALQGSIDNTNTMQGAKFNKVVVDANISRLQNLCGASIVGASADMQRLTIRHKNGNLIDIVTSASAVANDYYILVEDVALAITDYPKNMGVIKKK
jgi:DNA polymerase III gamma/tau subunit